MNPLDRLHDIESRLIAGTISVDQACTELFNGQKPWTTRWWKARRRQKIASACSTCGRSDPPLVLQHTWQPVKWKDALQRAGPPNWASWKEQHPLPNLKEPFEPLTNQPVCPQCGSYKVYPRMRTNDWICQVGRSGKPHEQHADFAFPEPKVERRPDRVAIRRHKKIVSLKYQELSTERWEAWLRSSEGAENRLLALRLYIDDSKRYLSLEDTKTLCRPCAAREDYQHIRRNEIAAARWKEANPDWSEFEELDRFTDGLDAGDG